MDVDLRQLERRATAVGASSLDVASFNKALIRASKVLCVGVLERETVHAYDFDPFITESKFTFGQLSICRGVNNFDHNSIRPAIPTCKLCLRALYKGRKLARTELKRYYRDMFDAKRCAIIDRQGTSILIRGNMPLVGANCNEYAYTQIGDAVNVDLASYDQFISISLIDNTGERDIWSPELSAFGVNPYDFPASFWPPYLRATNWNPGQKLGKNLTTQGKTIAGSLLWWPIEGLPATEPYPQTFLKSPGWDLSGLVDRIHSLLQEPKTAIYFHCMLGADRTGAVHSSYLVKYHNKPIDEALAITSAATAAGAPTMDYQRLARAYASNR